MKAIFRTIPLLILVFLVAIVGVFVGLQLYQDNALNLPFLENEEGVNPRLQLVTVAVVITATPDPNATEAVRVVTATVDRTQVALPPDILPDDEDDANTPGVRRTLDPDALDADAAQPGEGTDEVSAAQAAGFGDLPDECLLYELQEGDNPSSVALEYEVDLFLMLAVNNLTEESATQLQIGDILIVPFEGCAENLPPTPTPTPEPGTPTATPEASPTPEVSPTPETSPTPAGPTPTPTPTATITLAPTAENAQIEITVISAGDVTAEGVRLRNAGRTVDVTGWRLTDADGNEFVFTERFMFSNNELTVYTRAGEITPIAEFWGLDEPVWQPGDVVTLFDDEGNVQATQRIGSPVDLE